MPPAKSAYPPSDAIKPLAVKEEQLEYGFIGKPKSESCLILSLPMAWPTLERRPI